MLISKKEEEGGGGRRRRGEQVQRRSDAEVFLFAEFNQRPRKLLHTQQRVVSG